MGHKVSDSAQWFKDKQTISEQKRRYRIKDERLRRRECFPPLAIKISRSLPAFSFRAVMHRWKIFTGMPISVAF